MRILILGTTFPRYKGSRVGTFIFELAKALADKGCDVNVLTTNIPDGKKYEVMSDVKVHRFNYFFCAKWQKLTYPGSLLDQVKSSWLAIFQIPFFLITYIIQCIKVLSKYDVVVCNWIYTGTIMQIARKFTCSKSLCFVVIHGSDMKFLEKGGIIGGIFLKTVKKADAVCVVAKHFLPILKRHGVSHSFFMPNGIKYDDFRINQADALQKLQLGEHDGIILYVGRLTEAKGVDVLIKAMSRVNAKLIVVGEGKNRQQLELLAVSVAVDAEFVGEVAPERIPLWMSAATIFVLPSFSEGRPTVINEAMAAKTVCVASDIPGTRELIIDKKTGFLVEPGDSDALNKVLCLLLKDLELQNNIADSAYSNLCENVPTWSVAADNYIKLIAELKNS